MANNLAPQIFQSDNGVSNTERGIEDRFFTVAQASPQGAKTHAAPVGGKVLVIFSINDPELLEGGLPWSQQEYAGRKIISSVPDSLEQLATVLKSHAGVEKVDIWTHGNAAGNVGIAGRELNIASEELRSALANRRLKLGTVEFMACDIGNNPAALAQFGQIVGAKKVVGWTQMHSLLPLSFHLTGKPKDDAQSIIKRLKYLEKFLPAGIPRTQAELGQLLNKKKTGTFDVTLEYWGRQGEVPKQFTEVTVASDSELDNLFPPRAQARRDAEEHTWADTVALKMKPLIDIPKIGGEQNIVVQPFNMNFWKVTVTMTTPGR